MRVQGGDIVGTAPRQNHSSRRAGEIVYNYPYGLATLCIEGDLGAILHCLTGRYGTSTVCNVTLPRRHQE